jgi:hypothetical protein
VAADTAHTGTNRTSWPLDMAPRQSLYNFTVSALRGPILDSSSIHNLSLDLVLAIHLSKKKFSLRRVSASSVQRLHQTLSERWISLAFSIPTCHSKPLRKVHLAKVASILFPLSLQAYWRHYSGSHENAQGLRTTCMIDSFSSLTLDSCSLVTPSRLDIGLFTDFRST